MVKSFASLDGVESVSESAIADGRTYRRRRSCGPYRASACSVAAVDDAVAGQDGGARDVADQTGLRSAT